MKLPRTIRLDPSDTFVFARAAEPAEWAVPGTFLFSGADLATLAPKERQAFRAGFLGVDSFGWSTLVVVVEASAGERDDAVERLGRQLFAHCGAPDWASARTAAEEEIAFAESLCDHPAGTLLGLHRSAGDGAIRESFRTLHRRPDRLAPMTAFQFVEIEEDEPAEEVDLHALTKDARP